MLKEPPIDIVVPMPGARDALEACLASVREHGGNHRVIVADDALSVKRRIEDGRGDVVVLDAQVRVTRGWLDKLIRCARSDSRIGTVTPCIGGFEGDPHLVSCAVGLAAVPLYPDLHAATASCVYIRRQLLDEIGAYDDAIFARAREAGYRNVLCDDAYVAHAGCGAVDSDAQDVGLRPFRTMVESQLAVLAGEDKPGVLHVVHPRGGGTEKYIRELIGASGADYRHYFLRILPDRWRLTDAGGTAAYDWWHDEDSRWLRAMCGWLRVGFVHVHSLVGSHDDLLHVLAQAGVPYCYSVHDMYLPCPTVYLINSGGSYCNATTDPSLCRQCLSGFTGLERIDITRWRERYAAFLGNAAKVYAPSQWAADTLTKYYPHIAVTVAPPFEPPASAASDGIADAFPLPEDDCRHIGILGAIGPEKGARLVEALVARIRERRLPLRIVVVGYTDRVHRHQTDDQVLTAHGPYRREEIEALLDRYRVALVAFPTVWPETYSYTLSEGWQAGRPALVPPRGALQERVLATGAGWTMDGWPNVDAILDQMMTLTAPANRIELEAKARLAKSVFARDERPSTISYREMMKSEPEEEPVSRYAIYEAACRALDVVPVPAAMPKPEKRSTRRTPLERLVRILRD